MNSSPQYDKYLHRVQYFYGVRLSDLIRRAGFFSTDGRRELEGDELKVSLLAHWFNGGLPFVDFESCVGINNNKKRVIVACRGTGNALMCIFRTTSVEVCALSILCHTVLYNATLRYISLHCIALSLPQRGKTGLTI